MREQEFRAWLEAQGQEDSTIRSRISNVGRIERVYGDVDRLGAGTLDLIDEELVFGPDQRNRSQIEISGDLRAGLATLRSALTLYRRFLQSGASTSLSQADRIRVFVKRTYIDPARQASRSHVEIVSGDVHRKMGLQNAMPAVCGALEGRAFLDFATVRLEKREGPHRSSTVRYRFELLAEGSRQTQEGDAMLTREAVEAVMDECDALGLETFVQKYGRSLRNVQYWAMRNGSAYPSKAVANAAARHAGLDWSFGGTSAREALADLGYTIVDSRTRPHGEGGAETLPSYDPVNLILYGPPGTGKTYATAREAVRLCRPDLGETDPLFAADARADLLRECARLKEAGQIDFATFHQSYAYEDFVEGLRPPSGEDEEGADQAGGLRLVVRPGIFRNIAATAEAVRTKPRGSEAIDTKGRQIFKMSLGRAGLEDHIYDAAIEGNYVVLGWGGDRDWSGPEYDGKKAWQAILDYWRAIDPNISGNSGNVAQLWSFRTSMKVGDLVVISAGNKRFRAIGEVVGPYQYDPTDVREYNHRRAVRWLFIADDPMPVDLIYSKSFVQASCYQLREDLLKREALSRLLPSNDDDSPPDQYVLIIDEINRANISKVFGELITLIERDKRLGMAEALKVRLPYSGREFGVPANLHIVGTMNTADRSIALLDTALRRRFRFREVAPEPELLADAAAASELPLVKFLGTINDRIEYLLDREHRIGHAFLIGCRSEAEVHAAMRDAVIPLLQEYFFEDWSRVATVLGEGEKGGNFLENRPIRDPLGEGEARASWNVKSGFEADAYQRCIDGRKRPGSAALEAEAAE